MSLPCWGQASLWADSFQNWHQLRPYSSEEMTRSCISYSLSLHHNWRAARQTGREQTWSPLNFQTQVLQPLKPSLKPRNILLRPDTTSRLGRLWRNLAVSKSCRSGSALSSAAQQASRADLSTDMLILCRSLKGFPDPGSSSVSAASRYPCRETVRRGSRSADCKPDSQRNVKLVKFAMARLSASEMWVTWELIVRFCKRGASWGRNSRGVSYRDSDLHHKWTTQPPSRT